MAASESARRGCALAGGHARGGAGGIPAVGDSSPERRCRCARRAIRCSSRRSSPCSDSSAVHAGAAGGGRVCSSGCAFVLARRLASPAAGVAAAALAARTPIVLFQAVQPMNDIATGALWLAVAVAMCARRPALTGALVGVALLVRPNLAIAGAAAVAGTAWLRADAPQPGWPRRALGALAVGAAGCRAGRHRGAGAQPRAVRVAASIGVRRPRRAVLGRARAGEPHALRPHVAGDRHALGPAGGRGVVAGAAASAAATWWPCRCSRRRWPRCIWPTGRSTNGGTCGSCCRRWHSARCSTAVSSRGRGAPRVAARRGPRRDAGRGCRWRPLRCARRRPGRRAACRRSKRVSPIPPPLSPRGSTSAPCRSPSGRAADCGSGPAATWSSGTRSTRSGSTPRWPGCRPTAGSPSIIVERWEEDGFRTQLRRAGVRRARLAAALRRGPPRADLRARGPRALSARRRRRHRRRLRPALAALTSGGRRRFDIVTSRSR